MPDEAPPRFEDSFKNYLDNIEKQPSEAGKAFIFLEFARRQFTKVENLDYASELFPILEKTIKLKRSTIAIKGRPDALLGNLIIEFKIELTDNKLEEAKAELKKYIAILWSHEGKNRTLYITMVTDGINFIVYRPRTSVPNGEVLPDNVYLDEIDKLDVTKEDVGNVFLWLDRYLLSREMIKLKSDEFAQQFGYDKPVYKETIPLIIESWEKVKESAIYDQWASSLRIVYGAKIDSVELFIKHTYLATVAKLLAYASFSGGALPVSDPQLNEILDGRIFSEKWGIKNFIDEDFFSWVARSPEGLIATRMILKRLSAYDLSSVDEDILKTLYQNLVDPQDRHDLGEYYTPDWLAEYMVDGLLEKGTETVLDPACGSGTFLAATIRKKKKQLGKTDNSDILENIITTVQGIDVHPLAVILSRTTYLISLGHDLFKSRKGTITVPVYMANSIKLPVEIVDIINQVECYSFKADSHYLRIPKKVANNPAYIDTCVDTVKEYARIIEKENKANEVAFTNLLYQRLPDLKNDSQYAGIAKVLFESAETMAELIKEKRDTIWGFVLKNIYKPLFLTNKKIDIIVGNPPWISYRYISDPDYKAFIKTLIAGRTFNSYLLLDPDKIALITQIEIATLFFVRCSQLYLKEKGTICFVMPRSIFTADQHNKFRSGTFNYQLGLVEIDDLMKTQPLFKVPTCVVKGVKDQKTVFPINGKEIMGTLPYKNIRLKEALKLLKISNIKYILVRIGERSFIIDEKQGKIYEGIEGSIKSEYYKDFNQGATIVPRPFWFVELKKHPLLGIDPSAPNVESSKRAINLATDGWRVHLEGKIEPKFLYYAVTSTELLPFGSIELPLSILPIEPTPKNNYRIITSTEAATSGYVNLKEWLKKAEDIWKENKTETQKKHDTSLYSWLNYQQKLTKQHPNTRYKIMYNASGTYLTSFVAINQPYQYQTNGNSITIQGIIADAKTYYYDTNNEDEAYYLSAFLNSPFMNKLIKPMQSNGLWGPRDIHKKVLEFPMPRYKISDNLHIRLVEIGKECHNQVDEIKPDLKLKYNDIGRMRAEIREILKDEFKEIEDITKKILVKNKKGLTELSQFV